MRNKKYMTPLFLAASFLLVGCSTDTIVARPTWKNESIIVDSNGIKDNKLKSIYDAVKSLGDTNSAVLNKVMYDIAQSHVGKYLDLKKFVHMGEWTAIQDDEFKAFVNNHPLYQSPEKGAKATTEGNVDIQSLGQEDKLRVSFKKIEEQYKRINNDLGEKLYDEIKGGSYSNPTTKLFKEKNFRQHLIKELYNVGTKLPKTEEVPIWPKLNKDDDWSSYISTYLSINLDGDREESNPEIYDDYVDRKLLPELYKTYLTESYVGEQRYSSLGRSYARKVNMIAVPYGTHKTNVNRMMQWFAKTYITNPEGGASESLERINEALVGFASIPSDKASADSIYKILNFTIENEGKQSLSDISNFPKLYASDNKTVITYTPRTDRHGAVNPGTPTNVYAGTKLGDMMEKLLKFCNVNGDGTYALKENRTEDQDKAYADFTSNQTMTIEESIILKEREMRGTDTVKDGWFLKNGGLTDLDEKFREKLFNISASNIVDNYTKKTTEDWKSGEAIRYFGDLGDPQYRKAYLVTGGDELYQQVALQGSSNAFIVEVKEAANTSKLSPIGNNNSYYRSKADTGDYITSVNNTNKLVSEIIKANSNSDTYKKNANEYYLMISNIVFYDQSVYDYFKSQFPDLFK